MYTHTHTRARGSLPECNKRNSSHIQQLDKNNTELFTHDNTKRTTPTYFAFTPGHGGYGCGQGHLQRQVGAPEYVFVFSFFTGDAPFMCVCVCKYIYLYR